MERRRSREGDKMKRGKPCRPGHGMADPLFCPAPPYRRGRVLASRTAYGQVVFNWTLVNYTRFFEPLYLTIFASTLVTAFVTTLLTFAMGYPVAYTIAMILPKKWQQAASSSS